MAILNWIDAPEWASHIVGSSDLPDIQCWAKKVGDDYYNETFRETLIGSFHMDDDEDEPGFWVVVSARPSSVVEGKQ